MTDLTEQFNNDEIDESKLYYFKQKMSEEIEIGHPFALNMVRAMDDTYLDCFLIDKVLAPVPSFKEMQANQKWIKSLEEKIKIYERKDKQATETSIAYNELAKENEELKEIIERHKKATAKAQIRSCDLEIINQQLKERLLDMIDLLQKCYFYLNAVADGKVKTEHLEQIKTLVVLINNAIGDKK